MADNSGTHAGSGNGAGMKAHEATYEGFLRIFKIGAIVTFVIAAIVVLIIGS